ncbi:protein HEXIM1 [Schistocerca piceifrons]|uniref:protein HEXIM1 n=1 Tax=Schistocerca piceifrons TaxID=274613 RepID=UPI001F5F5984|nr:protein HEXIM1 [Schistocerca piceifrons]XP_047120129.1 protein HEXIM1 [Schistocerca piceifrons]XP_047120130.1 protein HEXIM1 [Schistocerca piceifrons]XP_047120131.1 protein HEXIM1 [Schistocerca piceifrons]
MSGGVAVAESIAEACLKIEPSDVARRIENLPDMQSTDAQVDGGPKEEDTANTNGEGTAFRKRKKTRRGKPKRRRLKPYSRLWQDDKQRSTNNRRSKVYAYGQPEAPFNTTQFLMADHDLQGLDDHLRNVPVVQRPPRARDSSFSVDSEDDYFYSSPEDEGEFLSKEFTNTYEDLHAERISAMSKNQLIQECLMLEEKVEMLETRVKSLEGSRVTDQVSADSVSEERVADAAELERLQLENEQLRRENDHLRRENDHLRSYMKRNSSTVSSVDSESDSSSSSCSTGSDSSESENEMEDCEETDAVRFENEEIDATDRENPENVQFDRSTADVPISPAHEGTADMREEIDSEEHKNSDQIQRNGSSLTEVFAAEPEPETAVPQGSSSARLESSEMDSEESK